jgi:hypothetical protein
MKIKAICVDQLGWFRLGNPSIYNDTYDEIEYEMNEQVYRCYAADRKLVAEVNKRFVIKIEYE